MKAVVKAPDEKAGERLPRRATEDTRSVVDVLGVAVDAVTFDEAVERIARFVERPKTGGYHVMTANPEMIMRAFTPDADGAGLLRCFKEASLVVADGIGVVWASRVTGTPLPERVAGVDVGEALLARAARDGWRVFFVGGRAGVAQRAAERMQAMYPGLDVVGTHHGYAEGAEEAAVIENVRRFGVDVLFVGTGVPRQELWIARHRRRLGATVLIGVGGALDVLAGEVARAPRAWRAVGLEWAYRIVRQPGRIRRIGVLPRFVVRVLADRWRGKG